jgi:hypothetical protein
MNADEPTGPASAPRVGAKRSFFESLDAKLAGAGTAVRPRVPAPPPSPPPPALSFDAWAELSVRFPESPGEALVQALTARGLTLAAWKQLDHDYRRALSDDVRAGQRERPAVYEAKYKEERLRRAGAAEEGRPPALPAYEPAPAHLRGTAALPDLPGTMMEAMGRMPFVPPAPEPAAQGKRPAKTVPSMAAQSRVGGQTMDLDAGALQRPTPSTPFARSTDGADVVYVPPLEARPYVALRAELALQPAPREETLRRYQVPNEAAFRALEEQWRPPARRAELETALADFAVMLRSHVLR